MTALCGGGASEAITGYTGTITLDGTSIAAYLALIGEAEAAAILAPLIAGAVLVVDLFCSTDPPDDPGIDESVVQDALNFGEPAVSIAAIGKIKDWFLHSYWCQVCTCSSGATPSCGTPSSPGDVGGATGLPGSGNSSCFDNTYSLTLTNPASGETNADWTQKWLPVNGAASTVTDGSIGASGGETFQMYPIPAGINQVDFRGSLTVVDSHYDGTLNAAVAVCLGSASTAGTCNNIATTANGIGPIAQTIQKGNLATWPSSATHWGISSRILHSSTAPANSPQTWQIEAVAACDQASLGCCPPPPTDPNISTRLDQIYALVQVLYSLIPVRVPNYAAGTAHTGLTGQGNISLESTTIAVKVQITELPDVYGVIDGSPLTYLEAGWITPTNNQGVSEGMRISRSTQTFELPAATSALDYTLQPGEEVTITELQAG